MNQRLAKWTEMVPRWWRDETGVTAIEYGLLAALIAVAGVAALSATGTVSDDIYEYWSAAVVAALAGDARARHEYGLGYTASRFQSGLPF